MIELKLGELKSCEEILRVIMKSKMPLDSAFKFSKLIKSIDAELKSLEEFRVELIKKLGEEVEPGKVQITDPEKHKEIITEFQEFLNTTVSIQGEKVPISKLGSEIEITPSDMLLLAKYFVTED